MDDNSEQFWLQNWLLYCPKNGRGQRVFVERRQQQENAGIPCYVQPFDELIESG